MESVCIFIYLFIFCGLQTLSLSEYSLFGLYCQSICSVDAGAQPLQLHTCRYWVNAGKQYLRQDQHTQTCRSQTTDPPSNSFPLQFRKKEITWLQSPSPLQLSLRRKRSGEVIITCPLDRNRAPVFGPLKQATLTGRVWPWRRTAC